MRAVFCVLALIGAFAVSPASAESDLGATASIAGDYLEARTADVYTGPCFANGEVNLDGEEAVMVWHVRRGGWQGVDLEGLTVMAAIKAQNTLGDPFAGPHEARAVIVVEKRATREQHESLVAFARAMGGDLLSDVVGVRSAPIQARFDQGPGYASVKAGDLIEASTRPLDDDDRMCGNESVFYSPLSSLSVSDATPAYTLSNAFRGREFDATWSTPAKRSSFVGEFVR